jgi:aryl-alcohol dehydrogenase-like predicted oxidoreductase
VAEPQGALADLRAAGSIGATGISNNSADRLAEREAVNAHLGEPPFAAIQMRYSYLTPRADAGFGRQLLFDQALLDAAAARGTRALAYSPLLDGSITRADRQLPESYQHDGTPGQLDALRSVAARHGVNANQVVLGWLLDQGIVPVLGVSSLAQLDEAFDAPALTFDDDDRETLAAARR